MDGHERVDVIKYQQDEFLPKMKEFERRMACYVLIHLEREWFGMSQISSQVNKRSLLNFRMKAVVRLMITLQPHGMNYYIFKS